MSVPARRAAVAYARGRGLSQRRACTLLQVGRSALGYVSRTAAKDAPALARMTELAAQYPRYGYRRIAIFLGRDGHAMSFGRAYRLWRRARLQVPRKRPRKRIATGRPRPRPPTGANQVWSYDFVFDRTHDGRPLKMLTIMDEYTRECLSIDVDRRLVSDDVLYRLGRLFVERGVPDHIRSDNGSEFTAKAVRQWLARVNVKTLFIETGSPWENGYIESFNGKLRDELLNGEIFYTVHEARTVIESWRFEYNHFRPHSSLAYRPPAPVAIMPWDGAYASLRRHPMAPIDALQLT